MTEQHTLCDFPNLCCAQIIYICGATAMGNSVLKALQEALGREIKSLRGHRIVEEFFG